MRRKRSRKKFYLIYFSHPEFIPVEADGEGAKPGRKQTSGSTAGAARWKQMDLHVCVDAGSEISVFTLLRLTHSCLRWRIQSYQLALLIRLKRLQMSTSITPLCHQKKARLGLKIWRWLTGQILRAFNVFGLQDHFFSFVLMVGIGIRSNSGCSEAIFKRYFRVCNFLEEWKALSFLWRCIKKKNFARGACC